MNLDERLTDVLRDIHDLVKGIDDIPAQEIVHLLDLTLLKIEATPEMIHGLVKKANQHQVAAICIFPQHLQYVPPTNQIKRATVVNFPTGGDLHQHVLDTVEQCITLKQADEIDYVFSHRAYLAGSKVEALSNCQEIYQLCKKNRVLFKVIVETGALPSNQVIYEMSRAIIDNGCDFLKTSTGEAAGGATIPDTFAILSAIVDSNTPCGIKVSGGIKTMEQAQSYIRLAEYMLNRTLDKQWLRIGASKLLDELLSR